MQYLQKKLPTIFYCALIIIFPIYFCTFYDRMIDDSYITLSYAQNLANNYTWGMKEGALSNAATSPLNVIIEFLFIKIGFTPLFSVVLLCTMSSYIIIYIMNKYSCRLSLGKYFGIITAAFVSTNPWMDSTIGLEGFIVVSYLCIISFSIDFKKYNILCACLGLSFVIRPELIIMNFLICAYIFYKDKKLAITVFLASSIILMSLMFLSWWALGCPMPDTFFIKTSQKPWWKYTFFNGILLFLKTYPLATIISFSLLLFVPFAINKKLPIGFILVFSIFSVLHFLAYSILSVPPYHWYYVPEISSIIILGSFGLVSIIKKRKYFYTLSVGFIFLSSLFVINYVISTGFPPITTNLGSVKEYKAIAVWMNDHIEEKTVFLTGELGVMQFYSHTNLVDEFSDRKMLQNKVDSSEGFKKKVLQFFFSNLKVPKYSSHYKLMEFYGSECKEGYYKKWYVTSPYFRRYFRSDTNTAVCMYKLNDTEISNTGTR